MDRFLAVMWGNGLKLRQEWSGEVVRGEHEYPGRRGWWLGPGC